MKSPQQQPSPIDQTKSPAHVLALSPSPQAITARHTNSFQARSSSLNPSATTAGSQSKNQWRPDPPSAPSAPSRPNYMQNSFPPAPVSLSQNFGMIQPLQVSTPPPPTRPTYSAPNYNISLSTQTFPPMISAAPTYLPTPAQTQPILSATNVPRLPQMGSIDLLVPSRPAPQMRTNTTMSKDDWGDFDPLS